MEPAAKNHLWLDLLPREVNEKIADVVAHGYPSEVAQNLALTCTEQRQSVLEALSHNLYIYESEREIIHKPDVWAQLFADGIKHIDATDVEYNYFSAYPYPLIESRNETYVINLLKQPTLISAHMFDEPVLLKNLSRSVRELTVLVLNRKSYDHLFQALALLDLTKLTIVCGMWYIPDYFYEAVPCPLQQPAFCSEHARSAIISACPNLITLEVRCFCNTRSPFLWSVLPHLSSVTEITFNVTPPDEIITAFPDQHSVSIKHAPETFSLAAKIGAPVVEIECDFYDEGFRSELDVLMLAKCPRLRRAAFRIHQGSEVALPIVAKQLLELEALELTWPEDFHAIRNRNYYSPEPGLIFHTVQNCPNLKKIRLHNICLSREEVAAIFQAFGCRLQDLDVCVAGQGEGAFNRLMFLMDVASMYATNLRRIAAVFGIDRGLTEIQVRQQAEELSARLNRLERRAVHLDPSSLRDFIQKYRQLELAMRQDRTRQDRIRRTRCDLLYT